MSVQPGPTEKRYAANGVTHTYAVPFLVIEAGDLQVLLNGATVTSGYVHTGIGQPISSITFTTAPAGDLFLQLSVPFQRLVDYQENGDFLSGTVNRDFDRIWQALKQLLRFSTRSLRLGDNDVDGAGMYRAKGNGIADLKDPVNPQDAVTKSWINSLIDTVSGVINNTMGIVYDGMTLFDYLKSSLHREVESIDAMCQLSVSRNTRAVVYSYYGDGKSDSRFFRYDPSLPKSRHNGGTIISPTVPRGSLPTNLPSFLKGIGESDPSGFGCWVDEQANNELHIDKFGAIKGVPAYALSNYAAVRAAVSCAFTHYPVGPSPLECQTTLVIGVGEYFVSGQSPLMLNRSEMIALPGAYRYRRGFTVKGGGRGASIITQVTNNIEELFFYSTKDPSFPEGTSVSDHVTWKDFTCRGLKSRTASLPVNQKISGLYMESYGWEKYFSAQNVDFEDLDHLFDYEGYGNVDHNWFYNCSFLNIREDLGKFNNNQSVANGFVGCHAEGLRGNLFNVGPEGGGDVTWIGGSIIQEPKVDTSDVPLSGQPDRAIVFWENSSKTTGPSSGLGNNKFTFQGIRVECYEKTQAHVFTYRTVPTPYGSLQVTFKESSFTQPHVYNQPNVVPTDPYRGCYLENTVLVTYENCDIKAPYTFTVGDNDGEIVFEGGSYTPPASGAPTESLSSVCSVLSQGGSIIARDVKTPQLIAEGDYSRTRVSDFTMGVTGRARAFTALQGKHPLAPWPQPGFSGALRIYFPAGSFLRTVTIDKPADAASPGPADYGLSVLNSSGTSIGTTSAGTSNRAISSILDTPQKIPAAPNNFIDIASVGTGGGSIFQSLSGNIIVEYI